MTIKIVTVRQQIEQSITRTHQIPSVVSRCPGSERQEATIKDCLFLSFGSSYFFHDFVLVGNWCRCMRILLPVESMQKVCKWLFTYVSAQSGMATRRDSDPLRPADEVIDIAHLRAAA